MEKECLILGGLVPDIYYRVDSWPQRGQDGFLSGEEVKAGGCAVNMAVTAENLGLRAHVVSCVGNDDTAAMLRKYLKAHGLSERFIMAAEEASGKCFVFVEPDGERTFLTCKGAEGLFPPSLADEIKKELSASDASDKTGRMSADASDGIRKRRFAAAGVTGYYLLNDDAERIMDVIEELAAAETKILFDPSPLAGSIRPDLLERMFAVSDIMTPILRSSEFSSRRRDGLRDFLPEEQTAKADGRQAERKGRPAQRRDLPERTGFSSSRKERKEEPCFTTAAASVTRRRNVMPRIPPAQATAFPERFFTE